MESAVIQRQYDDVIAAQYDHDPQNTTSNSLDRALNHLEAEDLLSDLLPPMKVLEKNGFEILTSETYEPELRFPDFRTFMDFAYHGGWLTPFVEEIGLHKAKIWQQAILNTLVFPVVDHHNIVLALARRPA